MEKCQLSHILKKRSKVLEKKIHWEGKLWKQWKIIWKRLSVIFSCVIPLTFDPCLKKSFSVYGQCWVGFPLGLKCNVQHSCYSVIVESGYPEHQNWVTVKNNACNKETEDQPSPFHETNALLFTDSVVSARESSCQRLHEGVGSSFVISSSTCLGCPGGAAAWGRGWGGSRNRSVPSCLKCIKFVFEVCVGTCHFQIMVANGGMRCAAHTASGDQSHRTA